jgi:hypothetical protein
MTTLIGRRRTGKTSLLLNTRIGNWWDKKGEHEIDLVALNEFDKTCVIAEIKRNPKKLSLSDLKNKASVFTAEAKGYTIEYRLLSIDDILG